MSNVKKELAVVILAAGLGTRMKSKKAKVLHEILGKPMVMYVVESAQRIAGNHVVLVIGNQAEKVRKVVSEKTDVVFARQKKQLGTGHAVLCSLPHIPEQVKEVIILCGDVPLLTDKTLKKLYEDHVYAERDISILAVKIDDPKGYGRILMDENRQLSGIVEETDASPDQKRIRIINTGIYCVKKEYLCDALKKIKPDNVKGEFYLTDIVGIGYREKSVMGVMIGEDCDETVGVNTRQDLMKVENIMRNRLRNMS